MGEDRTGEPQANQERLTVAQAAIRLGITEGAVRSRIKRGTLRTTKEGGTMFVLLGGGTSQANQAPNIGVPGDQSVLIDALRDQIEDLRRERDEWREQARITDRLLSAAMERIPAIEAPQEASEDSEPVEEAPDRAEEPRPATGGVREGTERLQGSSGWLAPVDKLSWWHYLPGLFSVFAATYIALVVGPRLIASLGGPSGKNVAIAIAIMLALAWGVPGVFGWWVGFRRRNPRFMSQVIPFGLLVGVVTVSGFLFYFYVFPGSLWGTFFTDLEDNWILIWAVLFPEWLTYVSGVLIGNAGQRLRTGLLRGTTPASPLSRATRGAAAQQPRKDLTPAQQAILGWGGAIISALITLVGTIIAVRSGP